MIVKLSWGDWKGTCHVRRLFEKILKFCVVGMIATAIDYVLLMVLSQLRNVDAVVSQEYRLRLISFSTTLHR